MRNNPQNVGKVQTFMVANGLSELRQGGEDVSPYSCFDSEMGTDFDEYSELRGRRPSKRKTSKVKAGLKKAAGYTPAGAIAKYVSSPEAKQRRADRRSMAKDFFKSKQQQKMLEAETQKKIADAALKDSASNTALLQQISATVPATPADEKKPMNKTLKIGLIVGGAIALVVTGIILYKKFKSKSK